MRIDHKVQSRRRQNCRKDLLHPSTQEQGRLLSGSTADAVVGTLDVNKLTHAEETAANTVSVLFYDIFAVGGVAGETGADAGTAPEGFTRTDKIRHGQSISETFCIAFTAEIINDQRTVPELISGFPEAFIGIQAENL